MFKKLLFGVLAISALFQYPSKAQSLPDHYIPDAELHKGKFPCGADLAFFQSLAKTTPVGSSTSIILPASFPTTAIDTCGKFRVFYVDKAIGLTEGFDGLLSGDRKRAIVCDVLNYVQSVIDFSSIPSGEYIRLYVDTSFTSTHPIYYPTTFVARAGANYSTTSTGVVNGYVHDFIKSGSDPTSLSQYHAVLQMNFDKINYPFEGVYSDTIHKPVTFYDSTGVVPHCMLDMYSTVLHEITHALGWHSLMSIYPSSTIATKYSSIDTSVHATTLKTSLTTLTNNFSGGYMLYAPSARNFWINNKREPENFPVYMSSDYFFYTDWATNFSHLDDQQMTYADLQRVSPGDCQEYVMSPFSRDGVSRRVYTKAEIITLKDLFTYTLNATLSSSATVTNHTPWSSKMSSVLYSGYFTGSAVKIYHEKIPADTILTNDTGAVWTFLLSSDTTLKDVDGDVLSVYPNSLVNFRGCGTGNDHSQINVSSDGRTITYTPKQNFVGRAQFGFNLYDGHEKGGFVLYTVDVYRGNKVSAKPGEELVLNGNFESGSEVKIRTSDEGINNTTTEAGKSGRIYGSHFSDSHPFDYWSWGYMPYGGGTVIRNSLADCDSMGNSARGFGSVTTNLPMSSIGFPVPSSNGGNRYHPAFANNSILFYLADSVVSCKRYILELDVYSPKWSILGPTKKYELTVGFTDTGKMGYSNFDWLGFPNVNVYYKLKPAVPFNLSSDWTHIKVPFTYCSDTAADMLCIRTDIYDIDYLFDNISIKEDTTKLIVSIKDTLMVPCSNTKLYAKAENYSVYSCIDTFGTRLKYIWEANGDTISADSVIYVLPLDSTKYIITVYDGCRFVKDSITLPPALGPLVAARDTNLCSGDTILMPLSISRATGTISYAWTPTTGLSCSTCPNPLASPTSTTIYTLTVTDSFGCFKRDIKITVVPKPDFTATDVDICSGTKTTISVSGTGKFTVKWDDHTLSCDTCFTVSTPILTATTDYIVSATNSLGCMKYDTSTVTVHPIALVTVTPKDTAICKGDSVSLLVTGGFGHNWVPPTSLSCFTCTNPTATPVSTTLYTVNVFDSSGCLQSITSLIRVNPDPIVVALPADTTLCGAASINISASGASSYLWTPSTGIASPTSASTVAYSSSSRSIVVTGADSIGCIGKDTINITVSTPPTVSVTTPIINTCSSDSLTLTATGASIYSWSPTTGFTCSTCNPTKVAAPSTATAYIVTGMDTNGCTDTAKVEINTNVCPCTPSSVFGATATTLTTGTLPVSVGSGYYYLPNNLTISSNTVMTGAKILIERGVTITVANNAKLTLDSCHLFTCDEDTAKGMWRGIILATGTASSGRIEVRNNCLIEDALFAIDAITLRAPSSGDIISVTNSTFNRNQVDISMYDYKVSSPAILPFTIKGNLFTARMFSRTTMSGYPNTWTGTATLKAKTSVTDSKPPYYISKTPALSKALCKDPTITSYLCVRTNNIGVTSSTGVYQSEVRIGEGASIDDYNLFDNHRYGVVSYNSNISLYHNYFINISRRMTPSSSTTAPIDNGMAVILQADKTNDTRAQVLASPTSGNLINKFHDCFMAIYTENVTTLNISNTNITTSNTAGTVVAGAAYPSEAYSGYGMMLHCEGIQKSTNISGNTISNVNAAIQLGLINPKPGHVASISNNFLFSENPDTDYAAFRGRQCMSSGIEVYTSSGLKWIGNTLAINNNNLTKVFNGILLNGLTNVICSTTNNTITIWDTITPVTSFVQHGIRVHKTNDATISANSISNYINVLSADRIRGVMASSNTNLRICGNTTTKIGRGFEFSNGSSQTGTRWIGNTINDGYKGMVLASDIGDQGFTYNYASPWPRTFYGAVLNKWNGTWSGSYYQTFTDNSTKSSLSKLYVKNITTGSAERPTNNFGIPIANRYNFTGTSIGTILITQLESNCQGAVYMEKHNPIPDPWGPKTLGLLIIADSLGYDSTYNVRQWMSQLSLYELGTIDPDLRDSSYMLDSFMNEAAGSRFAWLTEIESAINSDDLTAAQYLLDNPVGAMGRVIVSGDLIITDYSDADEVVENYTNYYTAYLQFLQGSMTDSDTAKILSIAQKCPVKDGAVVYKARALQQRLSFDYMVYNDDSCEYNNGQYRIVQNPTLTGGEENDSYTLYPNPNNGVFSIRQSIIEDKEVAVRLYNAVGVLIAKESVQFKNGIANFKVQNVSAGLYMICLTEWQCKPTCLKFNIH